MKKNKSLIATLLFFSMLLVASIGGLSVYAGSGADGAAASNTSSEADEASAATVSGCDLNSNDLIKVKVKQYGFSMLVPKGSITSLDSPAGNFTSVGYSRPYFMEQGCAMQVFTDKENYCAVSLFVEHLNSLYDYYGDYNTLSKEQQDELVKDAINNGNKSAEFVKINGRTYLQSYVSESSDDSGDVYGQYQFTTVIDSVKYMIYIQTVNAVDADRAVINEMIKSIKLNGAGVQLSGIEIALIVVVALLVIAVAMAYFFLYRINEFTNAGVKKFALIGFDMPNRDDDDDDDDDYDYDEDEADSVKEDDEDSDEDDSEEDDSDEDDSDDERIIKD